jgi:hypothetical protein
MSKIGLIESLTEHKPCIPYNLQFFAEDGDGAGDGAGDGTGDGDGEGDGSDGAGTGDQAKTKTGEEKKTMTQAELNAMMKKEKASGKRSAYTALGFKDDAEAKKEMDAFKAWKESQKTDAEKQNDKLNTLTSEKSAAEKKAEYLENKFTALGEGVKLEAVDDVVTIAASKVTDDKDLKALLADMKKNPTYASFFGEANSDGSSRGTGTGVGSGKGASSKSTGMGARLASANKSSSTTKSSYFSH